MGYLSWSELLKLNFKSLGENVLISNKASIYGSENISIGSNFRLDDFSVISAGVGGIRIGDCVHIACHVSMIGHASIIIGDYIGISGRTCIYSSSDDYSGEYLAGVTLPEELRKVTHAAVIIGSCTIIGAGTVILPGSTIEHNVAVGAMSLVRGYLESNVIYGGVPVKKIGDRKTSGVQKMHAYEQRP